MHEFVPLTDALLYDEPLAMGWVLVPYQVGYDCYHALQGGTQAKAEGDQTSAVDTAPS